MCCLGFNLIPTTSFFYSHYHISFTNMNIATSATSQTTTEDNNNNVSNNIFTVTNLLNSARAGSYKQDPLKISAELC